jgi:hypothetical protein
LPYTGKVTNCRVEGSLNIVASGYDVGGIGGGYYGAYATIRGCSVAGTAGSLIKGKNAGGIVGYLPEDTSLYDCSVSGVRIEGVGSYNVGGIAGMPNHGSMISNCTVSAVTIVAPADSTHCGLIAGRDLSSASAPIRLIDNTVGDNVTATAAGTNVEVQMAAYAEGATAYAIVGKNIVSHRFTSYYQEFENYPAAKVRIYSQIL